MSRKLILLMSLFLLSGCKTDLLVELNLSDLLSGKEKLLNSTLRVEVPSCQSYDDSSKESKSLLDAKEKVYQFIPGAVFKNCVRKKMDSFAYFDAPIYMNVMPDDKNVAFAIGRKDEFGIDLYVISSKSIRKNVANAKKNILSFNMTNFGVLLKLNNNTDSDFKTQPVAVYVDDLPIATTLSENWVLKKNESMIMRLSDVSVDSILSEDLKLAPVLISK